MRLSGACESLRGAGNIGAVVALVVWAGACGGSSAERDAGKVNSDAGAADGNVLGGQDGGGPVSSDVGPGTDLAPADAEIRLDATLVPDAPIGPDLGADVFASAPDAPVGVGQDAADDGDDGGRADVLSEDGGAADSSDGDSGAPTSCPDGGTCPCRYDSDCPLYYGCVINATISGCPSTPIGVCLPKQASNCMLHPNPCDCLPFDRCSQIPGTSCSFFRATDAGAGSCYGCLANP
jgi:hypothetical protein